MNRQFRFLPPSSTVHSSFLPPAAMRAPCRPVILAGVRWFRQHVRRNPYSTWKQCPQSLRLRCI
jgi:hypothetical protein